MPGEKKVSSNYQTTSEYEQKKLESGYKRLEEYECFYVFGKYDNDGNLLYRECFSKFDIDGAPTQPRPKRPYNRREF